MLLVAGSALNTYDVEFLGGASADPRRLATTS
jgi:hypothetical protein